MVTSHLFFSCSKFEDRDTVPPFNDLKDLYTKVSLYYYDWNVPRRLLISFSTLPSFIVSWAVLRPTGVHSGGTGKRDGRTTGGWDPLSSSLIRINNFSGIMFRCLLKSYGNLKDSVVSKGSSYLCLVNLTKFYRKLSLSPRVGLKRIQTYSESSPILFRPRSLTTPLYLQG